MDPGAHTGGATETGRGERADMLDTPEVGTPGDGLAIAQRVALYRLVSPLARGRRVLDVACGTAEGCVILTAGGAAQVVGIDSEQAVIEAARARVPPEISLERADLRELPFPDASFDVVTCLADTSEPATWLDELLRVLAPRGLAALYAGAVSAPALERELGSRLSHVRTVKASSWIALALLADGPGAREGAVPAAGEDARLVSEPVTPAPAIGSLLLAAAEPLPPTPRLIALAEPFATDALVQRLERQGAELDAQARRIAELEAGQEQRREALRQLAEAEQILAELPELRRRSAELEELSSSAQWRIAAALRVPGERARGMWLPAARRRAKQLLGRLMRLIQLF